MSNILIAGGSGYIGTLLSEKLLKSNHNFSIVDLMWFGNNFSESPKIIKKDILDLSQDDLKNFDTVVFMAGLSNDPMANFNPAMNFVQNISAPTYLAYISKKAGVNRFVYACSCSIYGYTKDTEISEDLESTQYPSVTNHPYGISKKVGELGILGLTDENFRPISLRKGTIGGWSPRMRFDLVINAMTKSALTTGKIIVSNPDIWRPIIDVRDVVDAYLLAINSELSIHGPFNILEDNYNLKQIATEIQKTLNSNKIKCEIVYDNIDDVRNYKASNKKANDILNFSPKYKIKDTVNNLLENITDNFNFNNPNYYNIEIFKKLL
tara:strand:+ start:341 stop:1309 length:969 start_codon:yes stop_codon:yes gene_type:complete